MLGAGSGGELSVAPEFGPDQWFCDGGIWVVGFKSDASDERLTITAPTVGAIGKEVWRIQSEQLAIEEPWMDSDQAISFARNFAHEKNFDVTRWTVKLSLGGSGKGFRTGDGHFVPRWHLEFSTWNERGFRRLSVLFDPVSGGEAEILGG